MKPVDASHLTRSNVLDILRHSDGSTLENLSFAHPWLEQLIERHQNVLPTHVITTLEVVLGAKYPFLRRGHFNIGQVFENMNEIINFANGLTLFYEEYVFVFPASVSMLSFTDDLQFYVCYTLLKQHRSRKYRDLSPSDIGVVLKGSEADPYAQFTGTE